MKNGNWIQQFSIVSQDMNLLKTLKKGEKK